MSSTKIVIVVLVLVAVIFAIFVATGAFSNEPENKNSNRAVAKDFTKNPPGWTKTIKKFIGSRQPKISLKQASYTSSTEETILPDEENPIRTATFRLRSGSALIEYDDDTEDAGELEDQDCPLPNFDNEDDTKVCSIVALKKGGTFKFRCEGNASCRVDVEK